MPKRRKPTPPPLVKRLLVDLHPLESNPRIRKDEAFRGLVGSISTPAFGVDDGAPCSLQPVVVNRHPDALDVIVGGHRRVEAAQEAGFTEIWTREANLDREQLDELAVRLNVPAGDWDWPLLLEHAPDKLGAWGFSNLELPPPLPDGTYDVTVAPSPVAAAAELAQLKQALGAETTEQAMEVAATLAPASTTRTEEPEPVPPPLPLAPRLGWVHRGRVEDILPKFPEASFDLIVADPPYFQILEEDWDHQWPNIGKYLEWLDSVAAEWQRLLKPSGALYCWSSYRAVASIEANVLGNRFDVVSSIVWIKANSMVFATNRERQRGYLPATERCIFAATQNADTVALGASGYGARDAACRATVFEPLRAYLDGEREAAGLTPSEVNKALGTQMAGHYFGRSQWALPTAEHYARLQELFNKDATADGHLRREYEDLRREYEDLRREYEDLRREYEDLRRPFDLTASTEQKDVWTYSSAPSSSDRHPAEKPRDMCLDIVKVSSRPGDAVLDCFAGHGSLSLAAIELGRDVTAVEMDEEKCRTIERRRVDLASRS